jgi:hypothetical protein
VPPGFQVTHAIAKAISQPERQYEHATYAKSWRQRRYREMKIRAGGEPYRNATATLMKIATGRSPTERRDIGRVL